MPKSSAQELLKPFGWEDAYQLLEIIGSGAAGEVWKAVRVADGKVVAIKLTLKHRAGDERLLARMEAEAEALLRLKLAGRHPGVVPFLDSRMSEHSACLVMEYVPGPVLTEWCEAENPGALEIAGMMARVADAAGWFHAHGITHRDLKPANVIVTEGTKVPVIVDFSIAKQADELIGLTLTHEALGTTPYLAPEQAGCQGGRATPASDVYSLGAILYELLTERHPHPGNIQEVFRRFSEEIMPVRPTAWNPGLPRDLERVVMKCLSHRPADRYPSGAELAEDLFRLADGGSVRVRTVTAAHTLWRHAKRRPVTSSLAAGLLLLFTGTAWIWQARQEEGRMRQLEASLAERLRARTWSGAEIHDTEGWMARLGGLSSRWRGLVAQDMVSDIKEALLSEDFWIADKDWISPAAMPWLHETGHPDASLLEESLKKRRAQWRTLHAITTPMDSLHPLLPGDAIRVTDGGWMERIIPASGSTPGDDWVWLNEEFLSPSEVAFSFRLEKDAPVRTGVWLDFDRLPIEIWLLQRGQTCPALPEGVDFGDDPAALLLITGGRLARMIPVGVTSWFSQTMVLTVRFENATLLADLNGRWTLKQDELFHFASTRRPSRIALNWPHGLGMRSITIRRRSSPHSESLMEQADVHLRKKRFSEAERLYTFLEAQPGTASEAVHKLGVCAAKFGDLRKAMAHWDEGSRMGDDLWCQLSALRLWLNAARLYGREKASPFMARLPQTRNLHPTFFTQLGPVDQALIRDLYRPVGRGPSIFHLPAQLALDTTAAWELSRASNLWTASECALKLHAADLDKAAARVLERALTAKPRPQVDETATRLRGDALDKWQRIFVTDPDPALAAIAPRIPGWDEDAVLSSLRRFQEARVLARAGRLEEAGGLLAASSPQPREFLRLSLGRVLLQGCLMDLQGAFDQAKTVWEAADQLPVDPIRDDTDLLMDAMILRTAARTWSRESVIHLLGGFVSQDGLGVAGDRKCAWFLDTFVKDDTLVHALNAIATSAKGRELIRKSALREEPWRVLIQEWLQLATTAYLEKACLWAAVPPNEPPPARTAAEALLKSLSADHENSRIHEIFHDWNTLPGGKPRDSATPPSIPGLQAMLQARWNRLQQAEKAPATPAVSGNP